MPSPAGCRRTPAAASPRPECGPWAAPESTARRPALSAGGAASCRPAAGSILRMLRPPDRGPGFAQVLQMTEQLIDIQAYGPAAGKGDQQMAAIEAQRQQGQNAVRRGLFQPFALDAAHPVEGQDGVDALEFRLTLVGEADVTGRVIFGRDRERRKAGGCRFPAKAIQHEGEA